MLWLKKTVCPNRSVRNGKHCGEHLHSCTLKTPWRIPQESGKRENEDLILLICLSLGKELFSFSSCWNAWPCLRSCLSFPFALQVLIKWSLSSVSDLCCFNLKSRGMRSPGPVSLLPGHTGLCHKTDPLFSPPALVAWVFNSYKKQGWVTLWTKLHRTNPKIYPKSGIQDSWKNWSLVDLCPSSNLLTNPVPSLEEVTVRD